MTRGVNKKSNYGCIAVTSLCLAGRSSNTYTFLVHHPLFFLDSAFFMLGVEVVIYRQTLAAMIEYAEPSLNASTKSLKIQLF